MTAPSTASRLGGWVAAPVRGYQRWLSPAFPPSCRFEPTCSAYAVEALTGRGPLVGLALSGWRLLRCAPWSRGGYDPVPPGRRTVEPRDQVRLAVAAPPSDPPRLLRREPSVVS